MKKKLIKIIKWNPFFNFFLFADHVLPRVSFKLLFRKEPWKRCWLYITSIYYI
jgi:hypothetical protein